MKKANPTGKKKQSRADIRNKRANDVCRELRWELANNSGDGPTLSKLILKWMRVAKKDKYTRPKI